MTPLVASPQTFADLIGNFATLSSSVAADQSQLQADQAQLAATTTSLASAFATADLPGLAQVNADGSVTIITISPKGQVVEQNYPSVATTLPPAQPALNPPIGS